MPEIPVRFKQIKWAKWGNVWRLTFEIEEFLNKGMAGKAAVITALKISRDGKAFAKHVRQAPVFVSPDGYIRFDGNADLRKGADTSDAKNGASVSNVEVKLAYTTRNVKVNPFGYLRPQPLNANNKKFRTDSDHEPVNEGGRLKYTFTMNVKDNNQKPFEVTCWDVKEFTGTAQNLCGNNITIKSLSTPQVVPVWTSDRWYDSYSNTNPDYEPSTLGINGCVGDST